MDKDSNLPSKQILYFWGDNYGWYLWASTLFISIQELIENYSLQLFSVEKWTQTPLVAQQQEVKSSFLYL